VFPNLDETYLGRGAFGGAHFLAAMSHRPPPAETHEREIKRMLAKLRSDTQAELANAVDNVLYDAFKAYERIYAHDGGLSYLPRPEDYEGTWYHALFPSRDVDRDSPKNAEQAQWCWDNVAQQHEFYMKTVCDRPAKKPAKK